ncbi:DUF2431 domain-containing protein [Aestuariibacter halophilus]|uniref:DUF2431 domain-containing protein n=1 Tax=Fluctibacter halophilus TaxID=226011 RepID=A0ABS8G667_9ALTE|nr:class I SAM-dependent methyltransferase [Aestuariibacter halophilus]MCC2615189.1 DUF2431 domain-containing protein [Aestuariibacter halophilus]
MKVGAQWRLLTVGDGDLSFSHAWVTDRQHPHLVATVFDDERALTEKYGGANITALRGANIPLHFGVDVTEPETFDKLPERAFDAVLFNFPLLPNDGSAANRQRQQRVGDSNLRHRRLLWYFLHHCSRYWLDPDGAGLAMITSKAVKPYDHWNLEGSVSDHTGMQFVGCQSFNPQDFPRYTVRNVDRQGAVKATASVSYVYRLPGSAEPVDVFQPPRCREAHCRLCGKGPFQHPNERREHEQSALHQRMLGYEHAWQQWLALQVQETQ